MQTEQAEIAIVGAGPAGALLASRLADQGRDVVLFDPKGAWEKPCGGGVPTRAIREFAYLFENSNYPRKLVRQITMISPLERRVTLTLDEPFAVYSREVLNSLVLDRAVESGARFIRDGVSSFTRDGEGWLISTSKGEQWRVNFLVGADGAASFTRRRLIGIFPKQDIALAFGYNIADEPSRSHPAMNGNGKTEPASDQVIMRFPKDFTGYVWAFPRPGVMNFGIASKLGERTSDELRRMLADFINEYYGGSSGALDGASFFGAKIPVLDQTSWPKLRAGGDGWALIGDAAGFVDPITGEGIYYALKSAELLTEALSSNYKRAVETYEKLWRETFGRDLERASQMLPRFYHGSFCGKVFTDAMVLLARHHHGVRSTLAGLVLGEQSYATLKRDLLRRAWQVF
jgi:flavin-dependent dehydrogenase